MGLVQDIKYESQIKSFDDMTSESVYSMVKDIKDEISGLDSNFNKKTLLEVAQIIESKFYKIPKSFVKVDLSEPAGVLESYREYSEGGCQSCINLGRETIDAQDASSGWYCRIDDPDYNKNAIGDQPGVSYSGFSPKIEKYYKNPCSSWKPRFSQTLEKLFK